MLLASAVERRSSRLLFSRGRRRTLLFRKGFHSSGAYTVLLRRARRNRRAMRSRSAFFRTLRSGSRFSEHVRHGNAKLMSITLRVRAPPVRREKRLSCAVRSEPSHTRSLSKSCSKAKPWCITRGAPWRRATRMASFKYTCHGEPCGLLHMIERCASLTTESLLSSLRSLLVERLAFPPWKTLPDSSKNGSTG